MMNTAASNASDLGSAQPAAAVPRRAPRVVSIDALRGLVMFTMIFVNDIAGVSDRIVPPWMKHFQGKSGMTFVDLVFPGFLFIVGMSIPFALGGRIERGEPLGKTVLHVLARTLSLLAIGILMVNGTPSTAQMGWSGPLWATLMYTAAIFAFCSIPPAAPDQASEGRPAVWRRVAMALRVVGILALAYLAFAYRGERGERIVSLTPFAIRTQWYGILGLIGWAYLVGAMVFLAFRTQRTALLGCMVLLLCLYPAGKSGAFREFWVARYVGIGDTLGALPSIAVAGILLATVVATPGSPAGRARFAVWFIAACGAGALLLHGLYGINKNAATPSWCLWSCALTAALWLAFYAICDVWPLGWFSRPLALAGQNVFLAYLLSDLLPSFLDYTGWSVGYGRLAEPHLACAVARSAGCALLLLVVTVRLNRLGFRLRL